jgi:MOSC domain-containing protein YiiM
MISESKGTTKSPIPCAVFVQGKGIEGDAHAETERPVSLLAKSSIDKVRAAGVEIKPGDFAENVIVEGIELHTLPVGTKLALGNDVILEVTQIGKECHQPCWIAEKVGKCVMPEEGIFAKVIKGGKVKPGDDVEVLG